MEYVFRGQPQTEAEYAQEIGFVRQNVQALAEHEPHWQEYLQAWPVA